MPRNHVTRRQPAIRLKLTAMLFILLGFIFPRVAQCDFSFYIPSDHVSWKNLHPERSSDLSPVIDLCGDWQYYAGHNQGTVAIPSCYSGYEGIVTFRKTVVIPSDWAGHAVKLHLLGVLHRAEVRINGTLVGIHDFTGLPVTLNVPPSVLNLGQENVIVIDVDNSRKAYHSFPLKSSLFAPTNFGGIHRELFLQAFPLNHFQNITLNGNCSVIDLEDSDRANLHFKCSVEMDDSLARYDVKLILSSPDGRVIEERLWRVDPEENNGIMTLEDNFTVNSAVLWQTDKSNRYNMVVTLSVDGKVFDQISRRISFRNFEDVFRQMQGNQIIMSRVPQWLQSGAAPSKTQLDDDLNLLVEAGVHYVRSLFFPPHPYFISACDSLGITLLLETPCFGLPEQLFYKEEVQSANVLYLQHLTNLAEDHPAITAVGWGSDLDPDIINTIYTTMTSEINDVDYGLQYFHSTGTATTKGVTYFFRCNKDSSITPVLNLFDLDLNESGYVGNKFEAYQADLLSWSLRQPEYSKGFTISGLNDWTRAKVILSNRPDQDVYDYKTGLLDGDHRPRLSYYRFVDLQKHGEIGSEKHPEEENKEPPWEYLVIGLLGMAAGLIAYRMDKLFRQNVKRSLLHFHRLITDIRERRFLQGIMSAFLLLLVSFGIGNLAASLLYSLRTSQFAAAAAEQLLPNDAAAYFIRQITWIPYQGIISMTVFVFLLAHISAMIIKLGSNRRSPLNINQALFVVSWTALPLTSMLPLSTFYLRFSTDKPLQVTAVIISFLLMVWAFSRLIRALSLVYRFSPLKTILIGVGVPFITMVGYLIYLQIDRQTWSYLSYIFQLAR